MPTPPKKIVAATLNTDGTTRTVTFEGNKTPTPVATAIAMTKRGQVADAHVVNAGKPTEYLRTDPDRKTGNNLDELGSK